MSCPMSFGELNIPSSRAFWDDCDEDELCQQTAEKLQLKFAAGAETTAMASGLFLIIEGTDIADFAEKTLLKKPTNENGSKICDLPSKRSSLHFLEPKTLMAIVDEDLVTSGEITQLLEPYARLAQEVVTVTIKPKVDYKSEHIAQVREEIVFWRGVNAQLQHVQALEPPNFISGVAAGIASCRENEHLPVSAYVAYVDNVSLDALVSQPVLKLLQQIGLECAASYTPKLKDDSHLYS